MKNRNAIEYISSNNLIGLKAGKERKTFLEIWMVVIDDRIFARSWGFAEKSWYNTFLIYPFGQIECGKITFNIEATIPNDIKELTSRINQAYIDKYNFGRNMEYVEGIIQQKHIDKTMEFVIL